MKKKPEKRWKRLWKWDKNSWRQIPSQEHEKILLKYEKNASNVKAACKLWNGIEEEKKIPYTNKLFFVKKKSQILWMKIRKLETNPQIWRNVNNSNKFKSWKMKKKVRNKRWKMKKEMSKTWNNS